MNRIRTVIIDDERQARASLKELIDLSGLPIQVVGEADGVQTGVNAILEHRPELLLLDIQLGDGTGFDVLDRTLFKNFKVVFITAYDQFALQAFKFSAVDYLLKPVAEKDFRDAISKVVLSHSTSENHPNVAALMSNLISGSKKRLAVPGADNISLFDLDEIIHFQSDGSYTRVFIQGGKQILSGKSLKEYESLLSNHGFERVHNSHLINMQHLKKYVAKDGGILVMSNGDEVPLAQRKKTYILALIS